MSTHLGICKSLRNSYQFQIDEKYIFIFTNESTSMCFLYI